MNIETKQTALLRAGSFENAENYGDRKETIGTTSLVVRVENALQEAATVRFYMGRSNKASVVYCAAWFRPPVGGADYGWRSGKGSAGGYGYHKQSAAFAEAVESAGINLALDVSGRGTSAIREALIAIACAQGYTIDDENHLFVEN